ncbi:MAG TPA: hypothetical protein VGL24_08945 [Chthoniobacterales bacterium]
MKISQLASLVFGAVALMPLLLSAGTVSVTAGPNFAPAGSFTGNSIVANDPMPDQAAVAGSGTITPPGSNSASIDFSGTYAADAGDIISVAYTFSVDSNVTGNTTFEISGSANPTTSTDAPGGGHFSETGTIMPGEHVYSAALPPPGPSKTSGSGTFNLTLTFHFNVPTSQPAQESPSPSSAAAGTINVTIDGVLLQVAPTAATPPAPGATPSPTPIGTPPPNSALLVNLSTRADVQTNDNVLIGGFIISGTGTKEVVLRGIGPSLPLTGTSSLLADPVLELHMPDGSIVSDDNWMDNSTADQDVLTSNALAPSNDLESAIVAHLNPGTYTVILSGTNSGTGVGLVEVYDLGTTSGSELANLSSRGKVEVGENVMIGGFILGPSTAISSSVVVRALGPSLTSTGVTDALSDPTLELHDSNGALIAANDNWADGPDAQTIADAGLAPTNALESALLLTSPPAAVTAVVGGYDGVIGVALVEIYNLR